MADDKKPAPRTETISVVNNRSGRPVAVEDLRTKLAEDARRVKK